MVKKELVQITEIRKKKNSKKVNFFEKVIERVECNESLAMSELRNLAYP